MAALPGSLSYFFSRLTSLSTQTVRVYPQTTGVKTANQILRFELPSNALLNCRSLRLIFNATCTGATAGGRLPNGIDGLIERISVSMGGLSVGNPFNGYGVLQRAKDVYLPSKMDATCGHPEVVRSTSYVDSSTIATTGPEVYSAAGGVTRFSIGFFDGLLSTIEPYIIDTGYLPSIIVEITLASNVVCPSVAGVTLSGTKNGAGAVLTTNIDSPGTGNQGYEVDNATLQCEVLGLASSVLQEITERKIAEEGFISLPFKNYFQNSSTHTDVTRFSVSSASLDRIWLCYRPTNYATATLGVHVPTGYKKAGCMTAIGDGGNAGVTPTNINQFTQDIGRPEFDIGGTMDFNKEKYIPNFFRFTATNNSTATYQLGINSSMIPTYKASALEMYEISKNSVDAYHTNLTMPLSTYLDAYHVQCFRFCLPDSDFGRLASGIDARSLNLAIQLETSGLAQCHLDAFCECTSELRFSVGRAIEVIQ